jgi:hypothetical protein
MLHKCVLLPNQLVKKKIIIAIPPWLTENKGMNKNQKKNFQHDVNNAFLKQMFPISDPSIAMTFY